MKKMAKAMRAMPAAPPTAPPTMGPIGVDDPPPAEAGAEVMSKETVVVDCSAGLESVVDEAAGELVVVAEGVMVSGEKERPSVSPIYTVYAVCQVETVLLSQK